MIAIPLPLPLLHAPEIALKTDEGALISGIRLGCEKNFNTLYQMYAPALMGIISRISGSEVAAEDILQETFVKIWNSIDSFDPARGRLFTWMAATARHNAIDHLRSKAQQNANKNSGMEDLLTELDISYHTTINPDIIGIRQLTSILPASEQEILDLIYFQGYTHSEASDALGIPLGTVKTKLRRAIGLLRVMF